MSPPAKRPPLMSNQDWKVVKQLEALGGRFTDHSEYKQGDAAPSAKRNKMSKSQPSVTALRMSYCLEFSGKVTLQTLELLKELPHLYMLSFRQTNLVGKHILALADIVSLRDLNIFSSRISKAGVRNLGKLCNLTYLILDSLPIADEQFEFLAAFHELEYLMLGEMKVGKGIRFLHHCQKLRHLDLYGTRITDANLRLFSEGNFPCLEWLALKKTCVTDKGLKFLNALPKLESLGLGGKRISDSGVRSLLKMPRLSSLYLAAPRITDRSLKRIAQVPQFQYLSFTNTQVTDAGLKALKQLPRLRALCLRKTNVTDAGLRYLAHHKDLTSLHLGGKQITDAGMKPLKALQKLQYLSLYSTSVTEKRVARLKEQLPNLAHLFHSDCL